MMCVAADYGNAALIELLIQKGADVNVSLMNLVFKLLKFILTLCVSKNCSAE